MWGITSRLVAPAMAAASKTFVASRPTAIARALPSITSNPSIRSYAGGPKTSPKKTTTTTTTSTTKKASSGTKKSGATTTTTKKAAKPKAKKAGPTAEEKAEKAAKLKAQKEAKAQKEKEKKEREKVRAQAKKEKEKERKDKERNREKARKEREKEKKEKEASKARPWVLRDADGKEVPLPKRPTPANSYGLFVKERFPAAQKEVQAKGTVTPTKVVGEVSKALATEWQSLSEAQKAEWIERARALNANHEKVVAEWAANLTQQDRDRLRAWNKVRKAQGKTRIGVPRDPTEPTPPPTPYLAYTMELRKTRPDIGGGGRGFIKEAAQMWKELNPEDKKHFEQKYRAQKDQYDSDLGRWKLEQELRH